LCDQYGIVLCFDEVITGFRVALGGAQEVFGVRPDLATYGKAIAAGLPFAAVAGRADIMGLLSDRRVVGAGTFNCFPLGMAAAIATFDLLAEDDGAWFRQVDRIQAHFKNALRDMAIAHGHDDLFLQGPRGQIYVDFLKAEAAFSPTELEAADAARRAAFRVICMEEGLSIGAGSRIYISGTMSQEDITEALARLERVFARLPKPRR
jgi:glutamate-1-semialdehyde 2,1-aminomutase